MIFFNFSNLFKFLLRDETGYEDPTSYVRIPALLKTNFFDLGICFSVQFYGK